MTKTLYTLTGLLLLTTSHNALAQTTMAEFSSELFSTVLYSAVGIVMGIIGFKVVDWLTPGSLAEEVAHKENRA
ncbi:MAG: DUF350 domain-containing protein, partial [Pseudomonadota bacterium]